MTVATIIQARMGSTRLPGKVMRKLCEKTVLAHVVERVSKCRATDRIVIATTTQPADDVVAQEGVRLGVGVFRGSEPDVLDRYYRAAMVAGADVVIRITADCPLLNPALLCEMIEKFMAWRKQGVTVDYFSNTIERSYPRGFDVEIFTIAALRKAHREAQDPYEREHVTPYLYRNPDVFNVREQIDNVNRMGYRLTLDTEADLELIRTIYENLYRQGEIISAADVLQFLDRRPDLLALNANVEQQA